MLGKVLGMHLLYLRICQGQRIGHAVTNKAKHRLLVLNFFQFNFIDMLLNIHKKNHISQRGKYRPKDFSTIIGDR